MNKKNIYIEKEIYPNLSPSFVLITSHIQVSLPEWSGRLARPNGAEYLRGVIALCEEALKALEGDNE